MLNLNPEHRPDIQTILNHPYFSKPKETFNPFISPVGTPERTDSFSAHNYFTEPTFGGEAVPNFVHTVNDDSPNRAMDITYSPVQKSNFSAMSTGSQKKARSVLNDEPIESKFAYSQEKNLKYKKAKSTHEDDNPSGFGGFHVEDFKEQKERSKSHIPMDDEVTNTDSAVDFFGEKNRKYQDEELPCFGSLVSDATQSINRRKSHYAPEIGRLGSNMKNAFGDDEFQNKTKNDLTITNRYKSNEEIQQDAPVFGAFGMSSFNNNLSANSNPSSKPKKQSI